MDNIENNPALVIDGVQLWNSFARSFQSPVRACFDLIDNVFDAAPLSNGKLTINVDEHEEEDSRNQELQLENTNGIYILNNCQHPVKPMREVLTCFNNVERDNSQIGEYGIGLKQGCASLSDISFVMSRNENVYSLGILARNLQTPTGVCLPSFEFQFDPTIDTDLHKFLMKNEIADIVASSNNIAAVVEEYGYGDVQTGIYRLVNNMMRLNDREWSEEKYVFCICLHDLKHSENDAFLLSVKDELPKHYLHVPHCFQVLVRSDPVHFNHWPSRLTRLTKFNVRIPKTALLSSDNSNGTEDDHVLSLYLGFDAVRLAEGGHNTASLYFYSRKFGRLVKSLPDSRGTLCLSAGGTQYCQALTIIVDDKCGALPLSPTKQDFAFWEHENGQVWEQNLLKWVSAVTKVYYNYYLGKVCNGIKRNLLEFVNNNLATVIGDESEHKRIDKVEMSTFEGISWEYENNLIQADTTAMKECPTLLHRACSSIQPVEEIIFEMIEEEGLAAFNGTNSAGITSYECLNENPHADFTGMDIINRYILKMMGEF
ncbi:hypothetical protein CTEN210_12025 [Chaetoceros tenuissimus]|uniref:Uncharacterized protein n=1 Tax=Chaetoceros tenuissimus TaxID=426638 RepID=A0AAD3HA29_9STRA|nr:hypothetical protein CTEN210_12025 [Chaetoceros tenuissimus]